MDPVHDKLDQLFLYSIDKENTENFTKIFWVGPREEKDEINSEVYFLNFY